MSRPLAVLRPEPGNAVTAARIAALGFATIRMPLFDIRPLAWQPPPPVDHDALILTSANALRHGGPGLESLLPLPVYAVGEATAQAALERGFTIASIGTQGAASLFDSAQGEGITHALHLSGVDRAIDQRPPVTRTIAVYSADPSAIDSTALAGSVVLLHSPRAAALLAKLLSAKDNIRIAALSAAVALAAGPGWQAVATAAMPDDAALIACAMTLAD